MWGRDAGGALGGLRLLLLLLLPGSMGLECLSCGSDAGSCDGAHIVSCPIGSDVCVEALGAVVWSHGRFWLGGRGCGRGQPGSHARALQLAGLVLFSRRRHCRGGRGCNAELPLGQQGALPEPAPASPAPPNGLRCFACPDSGPCDQPHVVRCAGEERACFHGNVTLTLGGRRLWREIRGCARGSGCSEGPRGDGDAALSGSCCTGQLCNGPGGHDGGQDGGQDGGLFAPDLPRLQLLPHGHAPTATPGGGNETSKMAAGNGSVSGDVIGVNGDVIGVNGSVNGDVNGKEDDANMAATVNSDVIAVNSDVIRVNSDVIGVNSDVIKVNGSANGVNGDVNGDVNGKKDEANMAAGVNGDVTGVTGDVNGVNGSVSGVNGDVNGDVIGVNSDVIGVNGSGNGDKGKSNMAAGVSGDVTTKMAAGRAGRPLDGKGGTKGPVGRGHAVGGASWLLPLLLWHLL